MITFIFVAIQLHIVMRRDVFQAIADPVRRDIIGLLANEAQTVNSIAAHFDISRPAVSRHIRILNECGIIIIKKKGRERYCRVQPGNLIPAFLWIEQYRNLWEDRFDAFEQYLIKLQSKNK
ncbi:MAG: metalloregulator ArsR/SmtB family transcription factor [Cytophagales bacterium]|nr:metalloregulator ArsR/SmtB family transcription factor [Cytophagales bacterium]